MRCTDIEDIKESPGLLALTPRYPPAITTLTLDGKLDSLLLVVHTLAQLDPGAFPRLRSVHILAHLSVDDVVAVEREVWASMDQTLSVLLSLGEVTFENTCKDRSHVDAGWAALVKQLPVLNAREVLVLKTQPPLGIEGTTGECSFHSSHCVVALSV